MRSVSVFCGLGSTHEEVLVLLVARPMRWALQMYTSTLKLGNVACRELESALITGAYHRRRSMPRSEVEARPHKQRGRRAQSASDERGTGVAHTLTREREEVKSGKREPELVVTERN